MSQRRIRWAAATLPVLFVRYLFVYPLGRLVWLRSRITIGWTASGWDVRRDTDNRIRHVLDLAHAALESGDLQAGIERIREAAGRDRMVLDAAYAAAVRHDHLTDEIPPAAQLIELAAFENPRLRGAMKSIWARHHYWVVGVLLIGSTLTRSSELGIIDYTFIAFGAIGILIGVLMAVLGRLGSAAPHVWFEEGHIAEGMIPRLAARTAERARRLASDQRDTSGELVDIATTGQRNDLAVLRRPLVLALARARLQTVLPRTRLRRRALALIDQAIGAAT